MFVFSVFYDWLRHYHKGMSYGYELSIGIFRVQRLPANAYNPLAKDLSIKEMLNFWHNDSNG